VRGVRPVCIGAQARGGNPQTAPRFSPMPLPSPRLMPHSYAYATCFACTIRLRPLCCCGWRCAGGRRFTGTARHLSPLRRGCLYSWTKRASRAWDGGNAGGRRGATTRYACQAHLYLHGGSDASCRVSSSMGGRATSEGHPRVSDADLVNRGYATDCMMGPFAGLAYRLFGSGGALATRRAFAAARHRAVLSLPASRCQVALSANASVPWRWRRCANAALRFSVTCRCSFRAATTITAALTRPILQLCGDALHRAATRRGDRTRCRVGFTARRLPHLPFFTTTSPCASVLSCPSSFSWTSCRTAGRYPLRATVMFLWLTQWTVWWVRRYRALRATLCAGALPYHRTRLRNAVWFSRWRE